MTRVYCNDCINFTPRHERFSKLVEDGYSTKGLPVGWIGASNIQDQSGNPWTDKCNIIIEFYSYSHVSKSNAVPSVKNENNDCKDFELRPTQ